MTGSSRAVFLSCALVFALVGTGCSKGATTLDETENLAGDSVDDTCESVCGNEKIDGNCGEECDTKELEEATCDTLGFTAGGRLGCDAVTCRYNTTMCRMKIVTESAVGTGG